MRFSTKFLYTISGIFLAFAFFEFGLYKGSHLSTGDVQNPFGLTNDQLNLALGWFFILLYAIVNMVIRQREKQEVKRN